MKRLLIFLISWMAALQAGEFKEALHYSLDGRSWHVDFQGSEYDSTISELTLEGETVNNWSELVTIHHLPPLYYSLKAFYRDYEQQLRQRFAGHPFKIRVIKSSENTMLFEWWVHDKTSDAQHEWSKIIKTPNSTFLLRYTTKKIDQVEQVRSTWEQILEKAGLSSEKLDENDFTKMTAKIETMPFVDEDKEFTMMIPKNWKVTRLKNRENGSVTHLLQNVDDKGNTICSMIIPPAMSNDNKVDVNELLDGMVEQFLSIDPSIKLIRYEYINSSRAKPIKCAVMGPCQVEDNTFTNMMILCFEQGDKIQMLMPSARVERFDEMLDVFKSIIPSFTLRSSVGSI